MIKIFTLCGLISALFGFVILMQGNWLNNDSGKYGSNSDEGIGDDIEADEISKLVLNSYQNISVKEIENFPHIEGLVQWVKYGSDIELYSKANLYKESPPSLDDVHGRFDTPLRTAIEYSYNWHHPHWTNEWCLETFFHDEKSINFTLMGSDNFEYLRNHAVQKFEEIEDDDSFRDQLRLIGELRFSSGGEFGGHDKAIVICEVHQVSHDMSTITGTPLKKVGDRWYVDYMPGDLGSSLKESINMVIGKDE